MTTWQRILAVIIGIIFGGIVGYSCIKPHIENFNLVKNEDNKSNIFDQYIDQKDNSTTDNSQEENNTTLTDESYKEVEVTGTDEQKAIALAKNTRKSNNGSVSYNISRREGSIFYISVNDNKTNEVLVWYKIDVSNGEVSEF